MVVFLKICECSEIVLKHSTSKIQESKLIVKNFVLEIISYLICYSLTAFPNVILLLSFHCKL